MLYFLQQVLNGLHMGALYALLAFGYVLVNGVLHRTNLAHGAIFAFSGQTMILIAVFGWQVLWMTLPMTIGFAVVSTFAYAALIAWVLARGVFEPLAKAAPNAIVVATLGTLIFLGELARIAADTHDFWLPPLLATPVVFAEADGYKATLTVIQVLDCAIIVVLLTLSGILLGFVLAGSIPVERAFGTPGLGYAMFTAVSERDIFVMQNLVLLYSCVFVFLNVLVDVAIAWLDPRIRYQ